MAMRYEFCVIGGGIVGLSSALAILERRPGARLVLIEKEKRLATHQTGRNSGVIHSGIYYAPDSLKAKLCREGCEATKQFCDQHGIAYDVCGKLLVATNEAERDAMDALYRRSIENGVAVEAVDRSGLTALEPNITGISALRIRSTGIVDYKRVCAALADRIRASGGEIRTDIEVTGIAEGGDEVRVSCRGEQWQARHLEFHSRCAGHCRQSAAPQWLAAGPDMGLRNRRSAWRRAV